MAVMHNRASRPPGTRATIFCFLGAAQRMFGWSLVCPSLKQWVSTVRCRSSLAFKILNQIPFLPLQTESGNRPQTITSHHVLLGGLGLGLKCLQKNQKLYITFYLSNKSLFCLLRFICNVQTKNQTGETGALCSLWCWIYCKRRIKSQIPNHR